MDVVCIFIQDLLGQGKQTLRISDYRHMFNEDFKIIEAALLEYPGVEKKSNNILSLTGCYSEDPDCSLPYNPFPHWIPCP